MVDEQARGAEEEGRQQRRRRERAQRRSERAEEKRSFVAAPTATAPAPEDRPGRRRGRKKRRAVTAADGTGMKYFEKRAPLLERLHEVGGERDKAGNRELHYDELCLLLLLGLFRPVVDSLRGLQPTSALAKVQQRLKRGRASLGSLSEASRVFDAELLKPSIEELGAPLQPRERDRRLAEVPLPRTLVDGTLLSALPLLMPAMWLTEQTGSGLVKWRLHTHFEVDRFVPLRIDVTPDGGGRHDERAVWERTVEADRLYVPDQEES